MGVCHKEVLNFYLFIKNVFMYLCIYLFICLLDCLFINFCITLLLLYIFYLTFSPPISVIVF